MPGGERDPDPVVINNSYNNTNELFLLYKTQSGTGQATIHMVRLDMMTNGATALGSSHQLLAAIPGCLSVCRTAIELIPEISGGGLLMSGVMHSW